MNFHKPTIQTVGLIISLLVFFLILIFVRFGEGLEKANLLAALAGMMSVLWITEAVPLAVTALIPLVFFPILGILKSEDTASTYINSTIFLFMGGFLIALAMERWNLHKRIALRMINIFGTKPSSIILGFMTASAFLSLWISNTATAVMILPIGLAILYKVEKDFGKEKTKHFATSLMLGIAYACSIGGVGTIIGTPPNLVFQRIYSITFPDRPGILFGEWLTFGVPYSIIFLFIVWYLLTKIFFRIPAELKMEHKVIKSEKESLGKTSYEEKIVLIIFTLTALLWIFRKDLDVGAFIIPGWSDILYLPDFIDDGTIAVTMAFILFFIPSRNKQEFAYLLDNSIFRKIPWEIILLFGGGFALAEGFVSTGLSKYLGSLFAGLKGVHVIFMVISICLIITFLTELTSNTATSQIVLPILAALSAELNIDPLVLMIPATLSVSMAFMLPVATPPNAIVFGSGRLRIAEMAKTGFIINIIGAALITLLTYIFFM